MPASKGRSGLQRRRQPRQQRARYTVEAILQATRELVDAKGFDAVTTRMIATRAGVSIGSLYQYFPTYESILFAWYEQVSTKAAQHIRETTLDVMDRALEDSVRIANTRLLEIYTEHRLALLEMPQKVPQVEQAIRHTSLEMLNRGTIRLFLSQHPEFDPAQTDRHVFFIETIVYQILRRYVLNDPEYLDPEGAIEEICAIILAYLERHRIAR